MTKVAKKKSASNGAPDVQAMARELCRLLARDDSDAGVVARVGLAGIAGSMTVLDGEIASGADPRIARRLAAARAILENTEHADDRRRWREIDAIETVRLYQPADPIDRVGMLYAMLKGIDTRWLALGPKLTKPYTKRLASDLTKKRPGAVKLAADLAKKAGIEGGNAAYKQSSSRHSKR